MKDRQFVILTLQYCLETFEQSCQCGRCDPCKRGQEDIREAIRSLEDLPQPTAEETDRESQSAAMVNVAVGAIEEVRALLGRNVQSLGTLLPLLDTRLHSALVNRLDNIQIRQQQALNRLKS
jgi:NADH:ubiquinone oxidoreductase subunit F (NADH-binding)